MILQLAGKAFRHGLGISGRILAICFAKPVPSATARPDDQADKIIIAVKPIGEDRLTIGRIECRGEFGTEMPRGFRCGVRVPDQMRINGDIVVGDVAIKRVQQPQPCVARCMICQFESLPLDDGPWPSVRRYPARQFADRYARYRADIFLPRARYGRYRPASIIPRPRFRIRMGFGDTDAPPHLALSTDRPAVRR